MYAVDHLNLPLDVGYMNITVLMLSNILAAHLKLNSDRHRGESVCLLLQSRMTLTLSVSTVTDSYKQVTMPFLLTLC